MAVNQYRRARTYLDLQHIVTPKPPIVHLIVRVIGITATLVLYEGKACSISD